MNKLTEESLNLFHLGKHKSTMKIEELKCQKSKLDLLKDFLLSQSYYVPIFHNFQFFKYLSSGK